jgi:hypothetical protein
LPNTGSAAFCNFPVTVEFDRNLPIVTNHRLRQSRAERRKIRLHFDNRVGGRTVEVLLNGGNRDDPVVSVFQATAGFF